MRRLKASKVGGRRRLTHEGAGGYSGCWRLRRDRVAGERARTRARRDTGPFAANPIHLTTSQSPAHHHILNRGIREDYPSRTAHSPPDDRLWSLHTLPQECDFEIIAIELHRSTRAYSLRFCDKVKLHRSARLSDRASPLSAMLSIVARARSAAGQSFRCVDHCHSGMLSNSRTSMACRAFRSAHSA